MNREEHNRGNKNSRPKRPAQFRLQMTPLEASQFLRLDQTRHAPESAKRTLNYWCDRGEIRATKYVRRVRFLKAELEKEIAGLLAGIITAGIMRLAVMLHLMMFTLAGGKKYWKSENC